LIQQGLMGGWAGGITGAGARLGKLRQVEQRAQNISDIRAKRDSAGRDQAEAMKRVEGAATPLQPELVQRLAKSSPRLAQVNFEADGGPTYTGTDAFVANRMVDGLGVQVLAEYGDTSIVRTPDGRVMAFPTRDAIEP